MNTAIESLGWTLLHSLWEGTLIGLLLLALWPWLARRSANLRCSSGCLALGCIVFAFGLTFVQVDHNVRLRAEGSHDTSHSSWFSRSASSLAEHPIPESAPARSETIGHAAQVVLPYVVLLWVVGCVARLTQLTLSWTAAQRLVVTLQRPASDWLERRCQALAHQLGIKRVVRIGESVLIDGPSVVGWLKPVILIPVGAFSGLSAAEIDGLLAHELAHIFRRDFAINLLQSVCEVFFFYHPAVWAISRMIRTERENACDDLAVELTKDPQGFATALVKLEGARRSSIVLAARGNGSLLARVRRLLATPTEPSRNVTALPWLAAAGFGLILAGLLAGTGIVSQMKARESGPAGISATSAADPQLTSRFVYPIAFTAVTGITIVSPADGRWPWEYPERGKFSPDDRIVITAVKSNRPTIELGAAYLVEGNYTLKSMARARLALSVTSEGLAGQQPGPSVIEGQNAEIGQGAGHFALWVTMRYPGRFHVSFVPIGDSESRSTIYFSEATLNPAKKDPTKSPLEISVHQDGTIMVDEKTITDDDLKALLTAFGKADSDNSVLLKPDSKAYFSTVTSIMDLCREAGITRFSLETRQ